MTKLVFILGRSGSMSGPEGDTIGSPYEFDMGGKVKNFPLFSSRFGFTDDTVMTLAVAHGFPNAGRDSDDETVRQSVIRSMRELGHRYDRRPPCLFMIASQ